VRIVSFSRPVELASLPELQHVRDVASGCGPAQ
jgi:hypothetical protein